MNDLIRWGILGTGTVAQSFIRGLALVPGVELAAVASRSPERAKSFAETFGVQKWFTDLAKMLVDSKIDVVYIATPNQLHREHALQAIGAHKAVLCEKPFALTGAEARDIATAAKREGVFCMEAMWMRFMPLVQRVRQLVMDGRIGHVMGLTADFALPVMEDQSGSAWRKDTGGGALLDRGIYCLSLASLLLGEPEHVSSTASITLGGVDATSAYTLNFKSGAVAVLWASQRAQGTNEAVLLGSKANLRLHEPFIRPHRLTLTNARSPAVPSHAEPTLPGLTQRLKENPIVQQIMRRAQHAMARPTDSWFEPVAGTGYQFEAAEVTRCMRSGILESPDMPLAESVRILELADELRRSWPVTST